MLIRFNVRGSIRFLYHAETARLFQRACIRAGIDIRYSRGFNPRPKMSLPLPRPVGIESDDELLCLRVAVDPAELRVTSYESRIKDELSMQLPEGCELLSVSVARAGRSFQPCSATYVLAVRPEYLNEGLRTRIERLLTSESLNVQRQIDKKNSKFKTQNSKLKNVDVRIFLKSIKLDDRCIIVECNISSAGSIRIDEVLRLLELDQGKLASPVRRTKVQWQVNES